MNLYLLQTKELGDYYVLALDPTSAKNKLLDCMQEADYGFYDRRKVITIKLIAEEVSEFPTGKPNFSSDSNLLIRTTYKTQTP